MSKWWEEDSLLFEIEKRLVLQHYPSLHYHIIGEKVKLVGELFIAQIDDSYSIELEFPDNYPKSLPSVKEVGGDIVRELDLHISHDGNCCLCLPQLESFYFPDGSNIITFFEKLVIPFFANQAYFKITGNWISGEYSHGISGVYEFYSEIFKTKNIRIILKLLCLSIQSIPNYNKKCVCGSNISIKKCHLVTIIKLKKYTNMKQLEKDLEELNKVFDKPV